MTVLYQLAMMVNVLERPHFLGTPLRFWAGIRSLFLSSDSVEFMSGKGIRGQVSVPR